MPPTTLRVTFGTQSAESQKADAVPAGVISAAIKPAARIGTAMSLLRSVPSAFGPVVRPAQSLSRVEQLTHRVGKDCAKSIWEQPEAVAAVSPGER